jgi:hypothetical protein
MDGDHGSAAVGVAQEIVAALNPGDLEACLPQDGDDLSPSDPRKTDRKPRHVSPGRARLATKPVPSRSADNATIGIVVVASRAGGTAGVPLATMTSTFNRTNSRGRN